jgi:HK97 gp10 family phage protein
MLKTRLPEIAALLPADVHEAVVEGAEIVADDARQRVPYVTGRLQKAIHLEEGDFPWEVYVVAGDRDAFYGAMVEHGGAVNRAPHPFMVPALEQNRARIQRLVGDAIEKATE